MFLRTNKAHTEHFNSQTRCWWWLLHSYMRYLAKTYNDNELQLYKIHDNIIIHKNVEFPPHRHPLSFVSSCLVHSFLYRVIHKLRVVSRTFSLKSEYNQYTHQTTCDFSVLAIGIHEKLLLFGFSSMHCVRKTRRFQRKEVKDIVSVYYISSARFESYIHSTHITHDTYKTKLFISRQNFWKKHLTYNTRLVICHAKA